jgi:lipoprotein-releasing system permease protein
VLGPGLGSSGGGSEFIMLKGIDPALEKTVSNIAGAMVKGRLDDLQPVAGTGKLPGIVIGKQLAEKLGVTLDDTIRVFTPDGPLTPMGVSSNERAFQVVASSRWSCTSTTRPTGSCI